MKASQPTGFGELEGLDYPVSSPDACELLHVHPGTSELPRRVGTSSRTPEIAALPLRDRQSFIPVTIDQGESRC